MSLTPLLTIEKVYADTTDGGTLLETQQILSRELDVSSVLDTADLLNTLELSRNTKIGILTFTFSCASQMYSQFETEDISIQYFSIRFNNAGEEVIVSLRF